MSPRKTRRGAKTEGANDKTVNSESISVVLDTPERTLRSRRQGQLKNQCPDSDVDTSLQLNESKRASKRKQVKKTAVEADLSVSVTVPSNNKRSKKNKESTVLVEGSVIYSDQETLSISKLNTTRGRRRGIKKKADSKKNVDKTENENDKNIVNESKNHAVVIETDSNSEDNEVAAASKKISKKAAMTPTNSRIIQLRNRSVVSPSPTVTPESSPITVHLTPHRTTKTPRKSPINIGSPKTHTQTPQRVSKTPRKLPVATVSPMVSLDSPVEGTPEKKNRSKGATNSPKTFAIPATRKSPRSPAAQSPGVISSKAKRSPAKKSPLTQSPSVKSPNKRSPVKLTASPQMRSPQLVLNRIASPISGEITPVLDSSVMKDAAISFKRQKSTTKKKSPITEAGTPLRRVSPSKQPDVEPPTNKTRGKTSSTPLPVVAIKRSIEMVSSTPRDRIRRSLNLSPSMGMSPGLGTSSFSVQSFYGSPPKISSTKLIENETNPLISDDESFNISGIKAVKSTVKGNSTVQITDDESADKNGTYEVPEPTTPALRKTRSNDTYELEEPKTPALKKEKKMITGKSPSTDDTETEVPVKRVCRVRFASPPMNSPAKDKPKSRSSRSATPGNKVMIKRPTFVTKRSPTKTRRPSLIDKKSSPRRRSRSLTFNTSKEINIQAGNRREQNTSIVKKRSLSVDVSRRSIHGKSLQESINRLSKPRAIHSDKKPEIKPPSARKIPNFAQIHQKKFAQMESLVDAKKRVADRHNQLRNNVSLKNSPGSSKPKAAEVNKSPKNEDKKRQGDDVDSDKRSAVKAKDAMNGIYNRFGFKVRKEDATRIVNKQLPPKKSTEKTKAEKRMALKGVRSNRRFEMLMQMRNIHS